MKRVYIDFDRIDKEHWTADNALKMWARWLKSQPKSLQCQPMFKYYRPDSGYSEPTPHQGFNHGAAFEIERAVSALPCKHRDALRWNYVHKGAVKAICQALGVTNEGLYTLVNDGRNMLRNRHSELFI
jgi:DNA-directed RNA polymerase specialized sigma24 family protein